MNFCRSNIQYLTMKPLACQSFETLDIIQEEDGPTPVTNLCGLWGPIMLLAGAVIRHQDWFRDETAKILLSHSGTIYRFLPFYMARLEQFGSRVGLLVFCSLYSTVLAFMNTALNDKE